MSLTIGERLRITDSSSGSTISRHHPAEEQTAERMNVLDLFSGIGGFSLGLERAGMRTVAFCEIEPWCRAVLAKHWPGIPIFEDVTRLRGSDVGAVDVICGGFPCQDISSAGKGVGISGKRSGLWREYARIIGELRPRFVLVENVAALLNRGLDVVLGDLAALGYDAEWHCIPASAVGAPHIRDRVWIVAYPSCAERGEIGFPRQRLAWADCLSQWQEGPSGFGPSNKALAYTDNQRELQPERCQRHERGWIGDRSAYVADAECVGCNEMVEPISCRASGEGAADSTKHTSFPRGREWWSVEPNVGRVAHGVSSRVDRLKGLGNAVVPQIPEIIGRAIMNSRHLLDSDQQ
jgi:DNA (cytosine-5)-methyltransferase 1